MLPLSLGGKYKREEEREHILKGGLDVIGKVDKILAEIW